MTGILNFVFITNKYLKFLYSPQKAPMILFSNVSWIQLMQVWIKKFL